MMRLVAAAALACALASTPASSRPVVLEFGGVTHEFDPSVDLGEQVQAIRALHERPDSESDAIIAMLEHNANDLSPAFLYELARRLWTRDRDRAFEWFAVAFIRSHYDGYRCVDRSAHQGVGYIRSIAENVMAGSRQDRAAYGRAGLRAFARPDVFAGTASPRWICVHGMGAYAAALENRGQPESEWLKPESEWAAIRDRLRTEGMQAFQGMVQPTVQVDPVPLTTHAYRRIDLPDAIYDSYAWADAERLAIAVDARENGVLWKILRTWRRDGAVEDIARFRGYWCTGNGVLAYQTAAEPLEGNRLRLTYSIGGSGSWTTASITLGRPISPAPVMQSRTIGGYAAGHAERQSPFDCRWVDGESLLGQNRLLPWLPLLPGHGVLSWSYASSPSGGGIVYVAEDGRPPIDLPISPAALQPDRVQYYAFRNAYFFSPLGGRQERADTARCPMTRWLLPREGQLEETCVPADSVYTQSRSVLYAPSRIGLLRATLYRETVQGPQPGGLYLTRPNGSTEKLVAAAVSDLSVSPDGCAVAFRHGDVPPYRLSVLEICVGGQR